MSAPQNGATGSTTNGTTNGILMFNPQERQSAMPSDEEISIPEIIEPLPPTRPQVNQLFAVQVRIPSLPDGCNIDNALAIAVSPNLVFNEQNDARHYNLQIESEKENGDIHPHNGELQSEDSDGKPAHHEDGSWTISFERLKFTRRPGRGGFVKVLIAIDIDQFDSDSYLAVVTPVMQVCD